MIPENELDSVFFVICLDPVRKEIVADYYTLAPSHVFRGSTKAGIYSDILDLCFRLSDSHKEYLEKELDKAEVCLTSGKRYVQG